MTGDLEEGERFAGYRIDGLLARGGMGTVYRARDEAGQRVALKVITSKMAEDVSFRRRFEREVRLATQMEHAHVVPLLDSGELEGTLFMVSRLIDGRDLGDVLSAGGPLSIGAAVRVTGQVASALDAAHALGLLHRDVKPQNVLLEGSPEDCTAYLTDFGLSKHVASTSGLTRAGSWVGTIDYAAPEQLQGAGLRSPGGRLCARLRALRDAHRRGPVPEGAQRAEDDRPHHRATPGGLAPRARMRRRSTRRGPGDGEVARRPLRHGRCGW